GPVTSNGIKTASGPGLPGSGPTPKRSWIGFLSRCRWLNKASTRLWPCCAWRDGIRINVSRRPVLWRWPAECPHRGMRIYGPFWNPGKTKPERCSYRKTTTAPQATFAVPTTTQEAPNEHHRYRNPPQAARHGRRPAVGRATGPRRHVDFGDVV